VHGADDGPVARKGETGLCLKCGADVPLPDGDLVGRRLDGGPPNPAALARPARGGGGRRNGRGPSGNARGRGNGRSPRRAPAEAASDT
jgi:hypothetical protein